MKGDGFQNGGTLVVGQGELRDIHFSSVFREERSGLMIECQTLEVLGIQKSPFMRCMDGPTNCWGYRFDPCLDEVLWLSGKTDSTG